MCMRLVLFMCADTRMSARVFMHVLRVCTCVYTYAYIYVRVYTCVHTRKHLLLHGYVGVHAPILLYIFSCYPIWCVTMRWLVTQLRLPPATCQGYFSFLHVPLRLVGANFVPSPFCLFFSLDHFTEDSPCAKPVWFVFFSCTNLPALCHCCSTWRRENRP